MIKCHKSPRLRRSLRLVVGLLRRYQRHGVARSCAALTYYLVFAAFPLLVLLGTLPGALDWESESLLQAMERFVPRQVTELVGRYWADVEQNGGQRLLWTSVVFSLWLPVRATDCLLYALRRAFGTVQKSSLAQKVRTLLFTLGLMVTLALALVLITVGRRALTYVSTRLALPDWVAGTWNIFRFVLLALVLLTALSILYLMALERRHPLRQMMPGVLTSLASWMVLSVGFSYYVEHIAGYTLLYGSVAAVVVALLWLYMSGLALIMGAELNAVLRHGARASRKDENG